MDLERHVPVDLLPDSSDSVLESWLCSHPDVEVTSRDRGAAYIKGATKGVPQALQVADRRHIPQQSGQAAQQGAPEPLLAQPLSEAPLAISGRRQ